MHFFWNAHFSQVVRAPAANAQSSLPKSDKYLVNEMENPNPASSSIIQLPPLAWWDMSFRVDVCCANFNIIWKAAIVILLVTGLQVGVLVIDLVLGGLTMLTLSGFSFLGELYSPGRAQCTFPVLAAAVCLVHLLLFLVFYSM